MSIFSWVIIIVIGLLAGGAIALVVKALFFNPLPEWNGKHGEDL